MEVDLTGDGDDGNSSGASSDDGNTPFHDKSTLPLSLSSKKKRYSRIVIQTDSSSDDETQDLQPCTSSESSPHTIELSDEDESLASRSESMNTSELDGSGSERSSSSMEITSPTQKKSPAGDRARMKKCHNRLAPDIHHDPYLNIINSTNRSSRKRGKKQPPKRTKRTKKARNGSIRRSNERVMSASGSENEDVRIDTGSHRLLNESQEVSIHKIELDKFRSKGLQDLQESESFEEYVIYSIVNKFNGHKNRKIKYVEQEVTNIPKPAKEDRHFICEETYSVKIFIQRVVRPISTLEAFGVFEESRLVHSLIFYYRSNEIFVLSTGQAWNCVQSCSDYEFPAKIAARLLSEQGQLEKSSKALIGNEVSNSKKMKSSTEINPYDILELTTSFVASLRNRSSLMKLSNFREHPKTKMAVSLAAVRFKRRLNVCDFPLILDHFSVISRGEPTFKYVPVPVPVPAPAPSSPTAGTSNNTEVEGEVTDLDLQQRELDTTAHKYYVKRITSNLSKKLDEELAEMIFETMQNPERSNQLENFTLCHKYYENFFNAELIKLFYNNSEVASYDYVPTVGEVLETLAFENLKERIDSRLHNRQKRKAKSKERSRNVKSENFIEEFGVELGLVKISFGTKKTQSKPEKLLNFLEGSYWYNEDGRVYWHVMAHWRSVRDGYFLIVHTQFLDLVKDAILREQNEGYLKIPFKLTDSDSNDNLSVSAESDFVSNFVKQYDEKFGYYSLINSPSDEDHLGDMMYINDKNEVFLYFISRRLSVKALSRRAQIIKATTSIKNSLQSREQAKPSGTQTPKGTAFKGKIGQIYKKLNKKFRKVEELFEAMANARIVYAFGDDTNLMEAESQLVTKIRSEDLESAVVPPGVAEDLLNALEKAQYLDLTGSVLSKLLTSSLQTFDLNDNILGSILETNTFVWEHIMGKVKSNYDGIMLKLELQMIKRDLDMKGLKFYLCPIQVTEPVEEILLD